MFKCKSTGKRNRVLPTCNTNEQVARVARSVFRQNLERKQQLFARAYRFTDRVVKYFPRRFDKKTADFFIPGTSGVANVMQN